MKNFKSFFAFIIIALTAFGLAACDSNQSDPVGPAMSQAPALSKVEGRIMTAPTTGYVTVVHGVPGLVVDVYVNGAKTLPSFAPNTVTGMLELPEGNYDIVIVPEGGDPSTPAISGSAFLPAGANVSIVAHLDASGSPTLAVFVNDVSDLTPGTTRLEVRHTAAAPSVDVALYRGDNTENYLTTIPDLSNGGNAALDARPGRYSATLAPAGNPDPVFGPVSVVLKPKVYTIVYAVGSIGDGSFTLLTQTLDLRFAR